LATLEKADRIAFGLYEVDLHTGELWKAGFRVHLQGQPFKVLAALLAKPGEVVTREELQLQVWGSNTNVDFERALAGAVNKVREALGDSADNPRFIETLTKRGYRFIAPVTMTISAVPSTPAPIPSPAGPVVPTTIVVQPSPVSLAQSATETVATSELLPSEAMPVRVRSIAPSGQIVVVLSSTIAALVVVLGLMIWLATRRPETPPLRVDQLTHGSPISIGPPNMESLLKLTTDGDRILTSVLEDGKPRLAAIHLSTGDVQSLPTPHELDSISVDDISKDGSRLLLRSHLTSESEQPLWVVPSAGGSALRVGNIVAHDAAWMPDGTSILYATGNDLSVIRLDGGDSTAYARLPGRAFWLRWSPNGKLLRFTLMDPVTHTSSIWELDSSSHTLHPVKKTVMEHLAVCCGTWTADGNAYIFQASDNNGSNLWKLQGAGSAPILTQLTNGPLRYQSPVAARTGSRIFFLGQNPPFGMQQLVESSHQFEPVAAFLANANRATYSRDGQWVAWTDTDGLLWRARASDGSEKIQLTLNYLEVFLADWSPDGKSLVLMARERGKIWGIYLVDSAGGTTQQLIKESRNAADPGWSSDGRHIVFGREPDLMGKETGSHEIQIFDLATHTSETLSDSEGLFSPRWSPDGRWIAALALDQKSVMLYDIAQKHWKLLATTSAADPVWSRDSKGLYVHAFLNDKEPILRLSVPDGAVSTVANLSSFHDGTTANYFFGGLTRGNQPMVQPKVGTGNLYTLDLERR
jgi:Tol biopolymer transport system component/DNA-binding winged helix-turn-helix (wHTH) protein